MSRLTYGQVDLTLDGEVYTLRPTLQALEKIDRQFGSLRDAVARVSALSLEAIVAVVAAGANVKPDQALRERVFAEGVVNIPGAGLTEYLYLLMNPSGREPEEGEGDEGNG